MQPPEEQRDAILARLRRVEGQVRGVHRMIEEGRRCDDVVTQFSASLRALEQAAFKYFSSTLAQCAFDPEAARSEGYTPERLEKLFLQLA